MDVRMELDGVEKPNTTVREASAPFDKLSADFILRSSDLVDFRVHKCILSQVSPIFDGMFTLPQPQSQESAGGSLDASTQASGTALPVVTVQEASEVLNIILRICYPVANPPFSQTGPLLYSLLSTAVKYAMDDILPVLRGNLRVLVDSAPLRSYCLAVHFGFTKETKAAAQACLALPIAVIHSSNAPELKLIDASALLDLLRYHKRCSEQVLALRTNLPWRRADWVWFLCTDSGKNCPPAPKGVTMADGKCCIPTMWWYEYMYTMFERLQYTPCSTSISEETHAFDKAIKAALKCHLCEKLAQQQMRAFVKELGRVVDNKVSKVKLGA